MRDVCSKRLTLWGETHSEKSPPRSGRPDGQVKKREEEVAEERSLLSSSRPSPPQARASETDPTWTLACVQVRLQEGGENYRSS